MAKITIYWIQTVAWAGLIFWLSSQPVTGNAQFAWLDFVLKKTAHVVEYIILAFFFMQSMKQTANFKPQTLFIIALLVCGLYAVTDEIHQSFIPGRTPRPRDVLIDLTGITIGASLFKIIL